MTATWTLNEAPEQTGRTALVTGANTGIGFETARMLAQKGAHVLLACRDPQRGEAAAQRIRALGISGRVDCTALDLSDLESVAACVRALKVSHTHIDLLINNAGIMATPFGRTKQGFEMQLGVNHLGHFALTQRLLPLLEAAASPRVVVLSSLMHHFGQVDLADLNWERRTYAPQPAYHASKLANLMFMLELHRRLTAAGSKVSVLGAHPGVTRTELTRSMNIVVRTINPLFASPTENGALPSVRAATDPGARGGTYWGPSHLWETRGPPDVARIATRATDGAAAQRLFQESEKLTGLAFGTA